jgi:DNA-binding transcriptional LysR family regulator
MMPSPTELTYFLEIATTQNISRASERLGITQPSLSLAIKRLEALVGTQLLLRSKTGVTLTRAGHRFSSKARLLLDQWQVVAHAIKREEGEIAGSYRIGAHPSVACGRFATVLPKLLKQYPHLEISMQHNLSRRIAERVINFELDFGIVVNPIAHPDLVIRKLHEDEVSFFCADGFHFDRPDLVLCYDPELLQARWLLKQAKDMGLVFPRTLVTSSLELICSLVSSGAGVGILPALVTKSAKTPLVLAPFRIPPFVDTHTLIYRADSQTSQASKLLARAIEQEMKI